MATVTVYAPDDNLLKDIASGASLVSNGRVSKVYYESLDIFPNPERGWVTYTESHYYPGIPTDPESGVAIPDFQPVDQADLIAKRTENNQTIVFRYYYMEKYRSQDTIDAAYLNLIDTDLANIRAAGCKAVLRFAYSRYDPGGSYDPPYYADTTPARTYGHITQLLPTINANADVVMSVNAGLIGIWGEWYYSENWGNKGSLTSTDWANRTQLLRQWIAGLAAPITVGVRYPAIPKYMLAQGWISSAEFGRISYHNDAFLASDGDWGTYDNDFRNNGTPIDTGDIAALRTYLASVVPGKLMGGESANATGTARIGWSAAATDLSLFRFTYLNPLWYPPLYATWGDNKSEADRRLGYRLWLEAATLPATAVTSGNVGVSLTVHSNGYSQPVFNRPVQLIFHNGSNTFAHTLSVDIRAWVPGGTYTVTDTVSAPAIAGTYQMYVALPDPNPGLTAPAYAVRLANINTWDGAHGWNDLRQSITVT